MLRPGDLLRQQNGGAVEPWGLDQMTTDGLVYAWHSFNCWGTQDPYPLVSEISCANYMFSEQQVGFCYANGVN